MISIIDYGVGNIQSFINLFRRIGIDAERVATRSSLDRSSHLVLPGVGHFDHAMNQFNASGLRNDIETLVFTHGVPIIGVCVGMQMLAEGSDEGSEMGLNWIPGRVRALSNRYECSGLLIPHMGWNEVMIRNDQKLFSSGFKSNPEFYFLHSYYFDAKTREDVVGVTHYGFNIDVAVTKNNIHGVQFHPEKSHGWGEQLLKNFVS